MILHKSQVQNKRQTKNLNPFDLSRAEWHSSFSQGDHNKGVIDVLNIVKSGQKPRSLNKKIYGYVKKAVERHPGIKFYFEPRDNEGMQLADGFSRAAYFRSEPIISFTPNASSPDAVLPTRDMLWT